MILQLFQENRPAAFLALNYLVVAHAVVQKMVVEVLYLHHLLAEETLSQHWTLVKEVHIQASFLQETLVRLKAEIAELLSAGERRLFLEDLGVVFASYYREILDHLIVVENVGAVCMDLLLRNYIRDLWLQLYLSLLLRTANDFALLVGMIALLVVLLFVNLLN